MPAKYKMQKNLYVVLAIMTLIIYNSNTTFAQVIPATFGNGLKINGLDSTFYLRIGFRFQNQVVAEWNLTDEGLGFEASNDVRALVRRSRVKFDGWAYSPRLKYKLELALANSGTGGNNTQNFNSTANIILDAFVEYNFYKGLSLKFGQAKLAGNRERVLSSGDLQLVDRSRLNSRFNIDRDFLFELSHENTFGESVIVRKSASISTGEGRNHLTGTNNGFGYTYRLEILPFGSFQDKGDYVGSDILKENTPKLAVGFTYDNNNQAGRERGQNGNFIINSEGDIVGKDLNTFFADMMFKFQGYSIMIEYVDKAADNGPLVIDENDTIIGTYYTGSAYNINAGYMVSGDTEVALRYTDISADTATDERHYTIGLNKFFVGHKLKLQTDFTFIDRAQEQNTTMWRTQLEIHF